MRVLMLSTDKNIFVDGSGVWQRMVDYAGLVDELHVIVATHSSHLTAHNFGNVFLYPANDRFWFLYFLNAYKIGKSIIRNLKFEIKNCVITCQDPFETGLVGYLLKIKFKLPFQIQIHTDFLSPHFYRESVKNKIRVFLAKQILKKADNIRVVSERIKKSIILELGILAKKVSVLAIFVDVESIKNTVVSVDLHKKYPGKFIILMASRLTKEKNIGLAIKTMRVVIKKYPEALLLIVGSGPERENIKYQISNLKLQDNVVIEDWSDDLSSYYKTADLFLLTSNYEGYGRTVIEAAACGLPVVMTDVGAAIGSVVAVNDRNGLIKAILDIISNSENRYKILDQQNKFLENWPTKTEYLSKIKQSWQECFL